MNPTIRRMIPLLLFVLAAVVAYAAAGLDLRDHCEAVDR